MIITYTMKITLETINVCYHIDKESGRLSGVQRTAAQRTSELVRIVVEEHLRQLETSSLPLYTRVLSF